MRGGWVAFGVVAGIVGAKVALGAFPKADRALTRFGVKLTGGIDAFEWPLGDPENPNGLPAEPVDDSGSRMGPVTLPTVYV